MRASVRRTVSACVAVLLVAAGLTAGTASGTQPKPNIVLVMTDDMSVDLMRYLSEVRRMQREGTTFDSYYVGDSLCCTSRASVLTGLFPHNSKVRQNVPPLGGWERFVDPDADGDRGDSHERRTFAARLKDDAGYRTGHVGKYLNGYDPKARPVPPGWTEWHSVDHFGYCQKDYQVTNYLEGRDDPSDPPLDSPSQYGTDLIGKRASGFLERAQQNHPDDPFFLQVAPFAPHSRVKSCDPEPRFPPAPRDLPNDGDTDGDCGGPAGQAGDCSALSADNSPAYDEATDQPAPDKPAWVRKEPLNDEEHRQLTKDFRDRVRMMQAVDDMIGQVRSALSPETAANTYFVFTSDNGFHLGQHRLLRGKESPYEHDARTPFVVVGPGVPAGAHRQELAQNTDLFPTFLAMAGVTGYPSDGMSLLGLMHGQEQQDWRRAAFLEHWPVDPSARGEPDNEAAQGGNSTPPRYKAIRTADGEKYVEYVTGERELYDLSAHPYENDNSYDASHPPTRLADWLDEFRGCGHDQPVTCQQAARG